MKSLKYLIVSFIVLLILLGGCRRAGTWLIKNDHPAHADAMVILMGGIADRVLEVADLYNEKVSGKILIVKESMGAYKQLEERGAFIISTTQQVHDAFVSLGLPADSITILPGDALSTMMEAMAVRDYLKNQREIDTLLIVSSSSHTRRASMIFNAAMQTLGRPVTVLSSPSKYSGFDGKKWWKRRESIQEVLMEYLKMGGFVVFEKRKLKAGNE